MSIANEPASRRAAAIYASSSLPPYRHLSLQQWGASPPHPPRSNLWSIVRIQKTPPTSLRSYSQDHTASSVLHELGVVVGVDAQNQKQTNKQANKHEHGSYRIMFAATHLQSNKQALKYYKTSIMIVRCMIITNQQRSNQAQRVCHPWSWQTYIIRAWFMTITNKQAQCSALRLFVYCNGNGCAIQIIIADKQANKHHVIAIQKLYNQTNKQTCIMVARLWSFTRFKQSSQTNKQTGIASAWAIIPLAFIFRSFQHSASFFAIHRSHHPASLHLSQFQACCAIFRNSQHAKHFFTTAHVRKLSSELRRAACSTALESKSKISCKANKEKQ